MTFSAETPQPKPAKPSLLRRKGVQLALAGFIGLTIGASLGGTDTADDTELVAMTAERDEAKAAAADAAGAAKKEMAAERQAMEQEIAAERDALAKQKADLDAREAAVSGKEAAAEANQFDGTGTYMVGTDIQPGTYRADASGGCYYARLSGLGGEIDDIISNDNADGPVIVVIKPTDAAFTANRCATFRKAD
jgi:hypothetical protein